MALAMLGEQRIAELSEPTKEGRHCSLHFEQAKLEVIQSYRWRDARRRAALAQLSAAPAFGWLYQYQLPTDLVRVMEVRYLNTFDSAAPIRNWRIEGDVLLCDQDEIGVIYIADVDVTSLQPLLVQAIATLLAAKMALALTGDERLQLALYQKAEMDASKAWYKDCQEHASAENSSLKRDNATSVPLVKARGVGELVIPIASEEEETTPNPDPDNVLLGPDGPIYGPDGPILIP